MDLGSTILSETKKKKDKYYMISLIYGIWKNPQAKKWKKNHKYREQTGSYQRDRGLEGQQNG